MDAYQATYDAVRSKISGGGDLSGAVSQSVSDHRSRVLCSSYGNAATQRLDAP